MWEFRRNPEGLSEAEKGKLEGLFGELPRLRALYEIRVRFREVFEAAPDRRKALREFVGLWLDILDQFPALDSFIRTFESWQEEILNYFEAGQTSGPVEGVNNK
jgi:transposase